LGPAPRAAASSIFEQLPGPERTARLETVHITAFTRPTETAFVNCPTCGSQAIIDTEIVRITRIRYDDQTDEVERDIVSIVRGFTCVVCQLELRGVHELEAAGLASEHFSTVTESLADRYSEQFYEPDYGND